MNSLSIIGPGRLGRTLGRVLFEAGLVDIRDVQARRIDRARDAVSFIGAGTPVTPGVALRAADLYLLSVPDEAITACCNVLAGSGLPKGAIVFHCSGALTSEKLATARAAGSRTASVHPVRSFADPVRVAANFSGTGCGIEGDPSAVAQLRNLFEAAGARVFDIDPAAKALYHAGAVFASNYAVTLVDVAMKTFASAGIPSADALALMGPMMREAVDNALRLGPAAALTGPIARGDLATVERHHLALAASNPAHAALYAALAEATSRLAAEQCALAAMLQPAPVHGAQT